MNAKLSSWMADGCGTTARGFDVSFAYSPIPQADIEHNKLLEQNPYYSSSK